MHLRTWLLQLVLKRCCWQKMLFYESFQENSFPTLWMIIHLRFQSHVSFSYFQSCVLAHRDISSAYRDTLPEVAGVDFLLGGDTRESLTEESEASCRQAGPAPGDQQ